MLLPSAEVAPAATLVLHWNLLALSFHCMALLGHSPRSLFSITQEGASFSLSPSLFLLSLEENKSNCFANPRRTRERRHPLAAPQPLLADSHRLLLSSYANRHFCRLPLPRAGPLHCLFVRATLTTTLRRY